MRIDGVKIELKHSRGLVYATSPDMRGLYVSGYTEEQVIKNLPATIKAMREADKPTTTG